MKNINEILADFKQSIKSSETQEKNTKEDLPMTTISLQDKATAQQITKPRHSNNVARWNAYINYLALQGFMDILHHEFDLNGTNFPVDYLSSFWEFHNGTILHLDKTRIILIPSEGEEMDTLEVPQEWIDIPRLVADYYVAIQVNLEDEVIRIIGVSTHQKIKQQGNYDAIQRIYSLDSHDLFSLNVMLVSKKYCQQQQPQVKRLPTLSENTAFNLIEKLGKLRCYSPRLEIPFEQWGVLLAKEQWRQQIYQLRQAKPQESVVASNSIHVLERIQNILESFCQTVEPLINLSSQNSPRLAHGYRSSKSEVMGYIGTDVFDLKTRSFSQKIALSLAFVQTANPENVQIHIEVRPSEKQTTLPINLQLMAIDQHSEIILSAKTEIGDKNVGFEFTRKISEPFSIRLSYGDYSYTKICQ